MGYRPGEGALSAKPRAFEQGLPLGERRLRARYRQSPLETLAIAEGDRVAADCERDLGEIAASVDASSSCHCEERAARRGNLPPQRAKMDRDCFAALAMTART